MCAQVRAQRNAKKLFNESPDDAIVKKTLTETLTVVFFTWPLRMASSEGEIYGLTTALETWTSFT